MRWTNEKPVEGTMRVISKFLFFPRTIQGETRWLERAGIRQIRRYHEDDMRDAYSESFWYWEDERWVDSA